MRTRSIAGSIALAVTFFVTSGAIPAESKSERKPVALVLSIENAPDASVRPFDHVFKDDQVDLRPAGVMKVAYLANCVEEVITGGRVKFRKTGRKLRRGAKAESTDSVCTSADRYIDAEDSDTYSAVQNLSPFSGDQWDERIIKTHQPIFQWPMGFRVSQVTASVINLDTPDKAPVWEMDVGGNHMVYPADAPTLLAGVPYQISIAYPGGIVRTNIFSIDPGLEVPDSIANRLVPLDW